MIWTWAFLPYAAARAFSRVGSHRSRPSNLSLLRLVYKSQKRRPPTRSAIVCRRLKPPTAEPYLDYIWQILSLVTRHLTYIWQTGVRKHAFSYPLYGFLAKSSAIYRRDASWQTRKSAIHRRVMSKMGSDDVRVHTNVGVGPQRSAAEYVCLIVGLATEP